MANTHGTLVPYTPKSLSNQGGKSLPLSVRDAACLSEILTETPFSENSQTVAILLAILHGITTNTTSGDVIELSIYHAQDICRELQIDEVVFREVVGKFVRFSKKARNWNPLAF